MKKTLKGTITFKSEVLMREAVGILNLSGLTKTDSDMSVKANPLEHSLDIVADYVLHENSIKTVVSMSKRRELTLIAEPHKIDLEPTLQLVA